MLANAKYIYALGMWIVEKRPNGWYFSKSAYHGNKPLMIATRVEKRNQKTP